MLKNIGGRIRDWWKTTPDPNHKPKNFTPRVHPAEQLEKDERIQFPAITNRHIWINYGFNRKERRRLEALGKQGKLTKIDKMMLKVNPRNTPARKTWQIVDGRHVLTYKTNNPLYEQ